MADSSSANVLQDPLDLQVERHVLENGLVVLLHEDKAAHGVYVNVCYRVGSKDEGPGQTGSAHLFEHLMFTGSENLPETWPETMKTVGATGINAFTTQDRTCYYETVPPGGLAFALYAEADRMGHFQNHLSEASLAKEKSIVLEEKAQHESGPMGLMQEWINEGLYPASHPYRHTIIGSSADIIGMSLEDARAWHRRFYAPDNAVLVLAGAIDAAETLQLVRAHFGHIPPYGKVNPETTWVPAHAARRRTRVDVPGGEGTSIDLIWHGPEAASDAAVRLNVFATLIGGSDISVLHRALVTAGHATSVSAQFTPLALCSQFSISLALSGDQDAERAIAQARRVLSDAFSGSGDAVALERIRTRNLADMEAALDSLDAKVSIMIDGEMLAGDPLHFRRQSDIVATVTMEALCEEARNWLSDEPFILEAVSAKDELKAAAEPRPVRPLFVAREQIFANPVWTTSTAENGLTIVDVIRPDARDFSIRLELAFGNACEDEADNGVTALLGGLPFHGAGHYSAEDLRSIGEETGLSIDILSAAAQFKIEMGGRASAAAKAAEILGLMIMSPRIDDSVLNMHKFHMAQGVEDESRDPMHALEKLHRDLIYGKDNIETRSTIGTAQTISAMTGDRLLRHHRRLFNPRGATLLLGGSESTLQAMHAELGRLLADWVEPDDALVQPAAPAVPRRQGDRLHFRAVGEEDQAIVTMALSVPVQDCPQDRNLLEAAAYVLRRRLNARLRDDLHWTYGVTGIPSWPENRGLFPILTMQSAVNALQSAGAVEEMRKGLRDLAGGSGITAEELDAYRNMVRVVSGQMSHGATSTVSSVVSTALRDKDTHPITHRVRLAEETTSDAIAGLVKRAVEAAPVEFIVATTAPGVEQSFAGLQIRVNG